MTVDLLMDRALETAEYGKHGKFRVIKNYGETIPIRGNENQLRWLFFNLIMNAAKSIGAKGCVILETRMRGNWATASVTDTGVGIHPENLPFLFDPIDPLSLGPNELSLLVCRDIVREHGGTIQAESEIGEGATFTVCLPTVG